MGTDEKSYIKDILGKLEKKGWVVYRVEKYKEFYNLTFIFERDSRMEMDICYDNASKEIGINFTPICEDDGLYLNFDVFMLFKNIICNVKSANDLYEIYEIERIAKEN